MSIKLDNEQCPRVAGQASLSLSAAELAQEQANDMLKRQMHEEEDRLLSTIRKKEHIKLLPIINALTFTKRTHFYTKRKSGEPSYIHPILVAQILLDYAPHADQDSVIAALLHDSVEHSTISISALGAVFGARVQELIDRLTQYSVALKKSMLSASEILERILAASEYNITEEALRIKLADRIHNMRTLDFLSKEKQMALARQTQLIFIPAGKKYDSLEGMVSELQDLSEGVLGEA